MSLVGEGLLSIATSRPLILWCVRRVCRLTAACRAADLCLIDWLVAGARACVGRGRGRRQGVVYRRYATLRHGGLSFRRMLTDDIPDTRALRMSPAINVYAAASTVYEAHCRRRAIRSHAEHFGHLGFRAKTRDIASPTVSRWTRPDYPIGYAPVAVTQLLRREPDVALAAAKSRPAAGAGRDSRHAMRWRLSMPNAVHDVVTACHCPATIKRSSQPAAVGGALGVLLDHYAQNVGRSLHGSAHAVPHGCVRLRGSSRADGRRDGRLMAWFGL